MLKKWRVPKLMLVSIYLLCYPLIIFTITNIIIYYKKFFD